VFRVQGLLPNMEICLNIVRKSEEKIGKIGLVHTFVDNIGLMFSGSIVYFQIWKLIYFYPKNSPKIRKK